MANSLKLVVFECMQISELHPCFVVKLCPKKLKPSVFKGNGRKIKFAFFEFSDPPGPI